MGIKKITRKGKWNGKYNGKSYRRIESFHNFRDANKEAKDAEAIGEEVLIVHAIDPTIKREAYEVYVEK